MPRVQITAVRVKRGKGGSHIRLAWPPSYQPGYYSCT